MLWRVAVIIYNLTLHPLAKIPGPRFQAAIDFPFLWQTHVAGNGVYKTAVLHQQYGSIVRVGPNRIVVDGAIAFPEIFAHSSKATEFPKPKNTFFPNDHLSLINAPKERHREMRRQLSHAFSDSALTQQEETIVRYVNMLMDCLDELQAEKATFNITEWLNYMTFDLIGELAFSKSFGSLESRRYHPWVLSIFQGIRGGAFRRFIKNYPFFAFICERFGLNRDVKVADRNRTAARRRADQRMQLGETIEGGKMDFMTYMMRNTRNGDPGMNADEILATSPVLVVAGSETTATTLTGLLFYLSRNPDKAEILINEIQEAYKSEDDISMRNTAALPYLHAAIEETLRIYPAAAFTTARLSPGSEVGGYYLPKGVSVPRSMFASYTAFTRHLLTPAGLHLRQRLGHLPEPQALPQSYRVPPRALASGFPSFAQRSLPQRQPRRLQALQPRHAQLHRQEPGLRRDAPAGLPHLVSVPSAGSRSR